MAMICRDHGLLFVMVPGTACSMLGDVLEARFGGEWMPGSHVFRDGRMVVDRKHSGLADLVRHGVLSRADLDGLLKFGTVRNPFDRFVTAYERARGSWFEDRMKDSDSYLHDGPPAHVEAMLRDTERRIERARSMGFEEWLLRGVDLYPTCSPLALARRLRRRIGGPSRRSRIFPLIDGLDVIMRYETLEQDFNAVLRRAGIDEHVSLKRAAGSTDLTAGKRPYREYYSPALRATIERSFDKELAAFGYSFEPVGSAVG